MGRTSRVRDRGGALRRRIRSGGRTSKHRAFGESMRRRTRRARGRARLVLAAQAEEGVALHRQGEGYMAQEVMERERAPTMRTSLEGILVGGARRGRGRRREGKSGDREKRKRRTSGDYRRRLTRGRLGAIVRRELGDRRERYLGRERRALSTYVLVGYRRGSAYATEAGRKYFRVGARGSCRRVRGRARVYGETGIMGREERSRRVAIGGRTPVGERGIVRRMWVIRFKRGARPVHRWVADIYEGAPTMAGRYLRMVPKRSRRRVRVRRMELVSVSSPVPQTAVGAVGPVRRVVCGRGSTLVGGRGRRAQRRWKRYLAYSGIGNVGNIRRGGLLRTAEGLKGLLRTLRTYRRIVRRRWGGRYRRGVRTIGYSRVPQVTTVSVRERKYVTERRGRGKENQTRARTRTGGRMSRVGRPPRLGFGAKRSVLRARVEQGLASPVKGVAGNVLYRDGIARAARALLFGVVSGYGYLRRVKRMLIEEVSSRFQVGSGMGVGQTRDRRTRKRQKEGSLRMGMGMYRRTLGWRNGEGVERRRERRGRERRKRVR